ncbi:MAG: YHS domain-containing protein [candidate division NC10 bacterium]
MSRSQKVGWKGAETAPEEIGETEARDPVCGMLVEISSAKYRSEASGKSVYFCCLRCKETFDRDPGKYAADPTR